MILSKVMKFFKPSVLLSIILIILSLVIATLHCGCVSYTELSGTELSRLHSYQIRKGFYSDVLLTEIIKEKHFNMCLEYLRTGERSFDDHKISTEDEKINYCLKRYLNK